MNDQQPRNRWWARWFVLVLVAVVAILGIGFVAFHRHELLQRLIPIEADLRSVETQLPVATALAVASLHTIAEALCIPIGILLAVLCGWLFGMVEGTILASFASVAGATLGMLISRYLLRDMIHRRFEKFLTQVDVALRRDGAYYLVSLRLIHVVPFWLINLAMGVTSIRVGTFWLATQIGMLPGILLYVYTGAHVSFDELERRGLSSILTPRVLAAFVGLAVLPLACKILIDRFRRPPPPTEHKPEA